MDTQKRVSKKDWIMTLFRAGHTPRVITGIVYGLTDECAKSLWDKRMAYIRVVTLQRQGGTQSAYDRRWQERRWAAQRAARATRG